MRAARERAGLKQEEVAERMNVSIHTFRPWDRGTRKPARLEQRKLLALIVGTPIEVLWPPERDPQVAEALRREEQRAASCGLGSPANDPASVTKPNVGRATTSRFQELGARGRDPSSTDSAASPEHEEPAPAVGGQPNEEPAPGPWSAPPQAPDGADGLPPWPVDSVIDDFEDNRPAALSEEDARREGSSWVSDVDGSEFERAPEGDGTAVTLTATPHRSRRVMRAVLAVGVAILLGGAGLIAATAVNDRASDAEPSAGTSASSQAVVERERAAVRSRQLADTQAQAARGDYDAAIVVARALGEPNAVERYRQDAANVLVRRADVAASRGDLSVARQRVRLATKKYGTTPEAGDVQARIRRIERARAERAVRRRAAARRQAQATSAAASSASAASVTTSPQPSGSASSSGASGSSSPAPASSDSPSPSSAPSSRSGGDECSEGCGLGPFP